MLRPAVAILSFGLLLGTVAARWNFTTTADIRNEVLVHEGSVFVGDGAGVLFRLDETDGRQVWNFTTGNKITSQAVVADGVVYIGSHDTFMYALDYTTGAELWNFTMGGVIYGNMVEQGEMFYITTGAGATGRSLVAFNRTARDIEWRFPTAGPIYGAALIWEEFIYFGSDDHVFYALYWHNGSEVWSHLSTIPAANNDFSSSAIVYQEVIFTSSWDSHVYAFDAYNGSVIWLFEAEGGQGIFSTPFIEGGRLFVGAISGVFYALTPDTGAELWRFSIPGWIRSSPRVFNAYVIFGGGDGVMYALDKATGDMVWNFTTGGSIPSTPTLDDSKLYLASSDRNLYSFDFAVELPSASPSPSPSTSPSPSPSPSPTTSPSPSPSPSPSSSTSPTPSASASPSPSLSPSPSTSPTPSVSSSPVPGAAFAVSFPFQGRSTVINVPLALADGASNGLSPLATLHCSTDTERSDDVTIETAALDDSCSTLHGCNARVRIAIARSPSFSPEAVGIQCQYSIETGAVSASGYAVGLTLPMPKPSWTEAWLLPLATSVASRSAMVNGEFMAITNGNETLMLTSHHRNGAGLWARGGFISGNAWNVSTAEFFYRYNVSAWLDGSRVDVWTPSHTSWEYQDAWEPGFDAVKLLLPPFHSVCPLSTDCQGAAGYRNFTVVQEVTVETIAKGSSAVVLVETAPATCAPHCAQGPGVLYTVTCQGYAQGPPCFEPQSASSCAFGGGGSCVSCPEGGMCPGGFRIWPFPGYWTPAEGSGEVIQCAPPAAQRCPGLASQANAYCGSLYDPASPRCSLCLPGHYEKDGSCTRCPQGASLVVEWNLVLTIGGVFLGLFLAGSIALPILFVKHKLPVSKWLGSILTSEVLLWLISLLQIVAQVGRLPVPGIPPLLRDVFDALLLVQFDVSGTLPLACADFHPLLLPTVVLALHIALCIALLVIMVACPCTHRVFTSVEGELSEPQRSLQAPVSTLRCLTRPRHVGTFASWVHIALLHAAVLGYPLATHQALSVLHCVSDGGGQVLALNPFVPCFDGFHAWAFAMGVAELLLGTGGLLLYLVLGSMLQWKFVSRQVTTSPSKAPPQGRRSRCCYPFITLEEECHSPLRNDTPWSPVFAYGQPWLRPVILVSLLVLDVIAELCSAPSSLIFGRALTTAALLAFCIFLCCTTPDHRWSRWKTPPRVFLYATTAAVTAMQLSLFLDDQAMLQSQGAQQAADEGSDGGGASLATRALLWLTSSCTVLFPFVLLGSFLWWLTSLFSSGNGRKRWCRGRHSIANRKQQGLRGDAAGTLGLANSMRQVQCPRGLAFLLDREDPVTLDAFTSESPEGIELGSLLHAQAAAAPSPAMEGKRSDAEAERYALVLEEGKRRESALDWSSGNTNPMFQQLQAKPVSSPLLPSLPHSRPKARSEAANTSTDGAISRINPLFAVSQRHDPTFYTLEAAGFDQDLLQATPIHYHYQPCAVPLRVVPDPALGPAATILEEEEPGGALEEGEEEEEYFDHGRRMWRVRRREGPRYEEPSNPHLQSLQRKLRALEQKQKSRYLAQYLKAVLEGQLG